MIVIAKCSATLAPAQHRADRLPDRGGAPERLAWTSHALLDAGQLARGGIEQVVALAPALLGQRRIAADHQARVRIIGTRDQGAIALVEQGQLQGPAVGRQRPDRRRPQRNGGARPTVRHDRDLHVALMITPMLSSKTTAAS